MTMRPYLASLIICCTGLARGQSEATTPIPDIVPPAIPLAAPSPIGCGHILGADLMIGLPTGVRVQAGLWYRERSTVALDLMAGALVAHGDIISGAYGGGPRLIYNLIQGQSTTAFQVNPGCYFLTTNDSGKERGGLLIAPTVDLILIGDFHQHFGCHVGTELGLGYDDRGGLFPVLAFFAGLRF